MEEIKKWLEDGGSYNEGLALFAKHNRNRAKMQYLMRKEDAVKLRYELGKIVGIDALEEAVPEESRAIAALTGITALDEKPQDKLKIALAGKEGMKFDALPPEIQKVYLQVCEERKYMRSVHERMKAVTTDEERAIARKELVDLDNNNRKLWGVIDQWAADGTLPEPEPIAPTPATVTPPTAQQVNSARASITRNLKLLEAEQDPVKVEALKAKLATPIAVIIAAGAEFTKNAEALTKFGLLPVKD